MVKSKIVNTKIDPDLWQKARVEALRQGITMQFWLTMAIMQKLKSDGAEVEHDTGTSVKEQG